MFFITLEAAFKEFQKEYYNPDYGVVMMSCTYINHPNTIYVGVKDDKNLGKFPNKYFNYDVYVEVVGEIIAQ